MVMFVIWVRCFTIVKLGAIFTGAYNNTCDKYHEIEVYATWSRKYVYILTQLWSRDYIPFIMWNKLTEYPLMIVDDVL